MVHDSYDEQEGRRRITEMDQFARKHLPSLRTLVSGVVVFKDKDVKVLPYSDDEDHHSRRQYIAW